MYTGPCPDTLASKRVVELNEHQIRNLAKYWPAAFAAVKLLQLRMQADLIVETDGDVIDAPLFDIVRWYWANVDLMDEA